MWHGTAPDRNAAKNILAAGHHRLAVGVPVLPAQAAAAAEAGEDVKKASDPLILIIALKPVTCCLSRRFSKSALEPGDIEYEPGQQPLEQGNHTHQLEYFILC
jgi:hypothetical protein